MRSVISTTAANLAHVDLQDRMAGLGQLRNSAPRRFYLRARLAAETPLCGVGMQSLGMSAAHEANRFGKPAGLAGPESRGSWRPLPCAASLALAEAV